MVDVNDTAPDFTTALANGDTDTFTLSDHLDEAPLVLAFFPGAFTPPCTTEWQSFRDNLEQFEDAGAAIYGVSVDTPFALNEFRDKHDLTFDFLSDIDGDVVDAYGVTIEDFLDLGYTAANRAIFVIDGDGQVTYRWIADEPTTQPDLDAVRDAVANATA